MVDIESTLPLHVRPLFHPRNKNIVIAALEMVNKKGILGRSVANTVTMDMMTCEILEVFSIQITKGLIKFTDYFGPEVERFFPIPVSGSD